MKINSKMSLEHYLIEMTRSTRLEDVWDMHKARMAEYGFDRLLYATTSFRTDHSAGDVRDALILTNHTSEFTSGYLDGGLFRNAPMVRWAMKNVGTRSFAQIRQDAEAGRLTQDEMIVVDFNRRHGVIAGYGISFPRTSARTGHGIGLSSTGMTQDEVDALWEDRGAEIEMLNNVAHLTILSLPYGMHGRSLTERQLEVLELVADGKTVQDVAVIMGRNPATVEKHLRLAREALDAENTAQAILKASVQNQFFKFEA